MLRRCPPQDPYRGVAQPGSALAWGASGRWFKSSRPDHWRPLIFLVFPGRSGASDFRFFGIAERLSLSVLLHRLSRIATPATPKRQPAERATIGPLHEMPPAPWAAPR